LSLIVERRDFCFLDYSGNGGDKGGADDNYPVFIMVVVMMTIVAGLHDNENNK
jgi:hypothetical protein